MVEVATNIVSKPLVSCFWRCGESVNPSQLNIQEVQGIKLGRGVSGCLLDTLFRHPISSVIYM